MNDGAKILNEFLANVRKELISDLGSKELSKGDIGLTHKVSITSAGLEGELNANHYWYFLVYGRKPGSMPPIESILGWIAKKGIQTDIKPESLAFLIARKIGRVGTDIFIGRRPGLAFEQILEENQAKFEEEYTQAMGEDIQKILFAKFKLSTK